MAGGPGGNLTTRLPEAPRRANGEERRPDPDEGDKHETEDRENGHDGNRENHAGKWKDDRARHQCNEGEQDALNAQRPPRMQLTEPTHGKHDPQRP